MDANSGPQPAESWLTRWYWMLLFLAATVLTVCGGLALYQWEAASLRREKYIELAAIAQGKIKQVEDWLKERRADVQVFAQSPAVVEALAVPGPAAAPDILNRQIGDDMELMRQLGGYTRVMLLSPQGKIILQHPGQTDLETGPLLALLHQALAAGEPVLTDFHGQDQEHIHMDLAAPVFDAQRQPLAVTVLTVSASEYLFPLIQSWPTPSPSAETLLVRRDGAEVLFLNELRHRPHTALQYRQPMSNTKLPAARALAGQRGEFLGLDYRGVEVLADLQSVPGTDWCMVTKIDSREIFHDLRSRAWVIVIIGLVMVAAFAGASAFFHRNRQFLLLKQTQEERRMAQQHTLLLVEQTPLGVIEWDTNFQVRRWNPAAEKIFGFTRAQAMGQSAQIILPPQARAHVEQIWQSLLTQHGGRHAVNENLTKDGRTIICEWFNSTLVDHNGDTIGVASLVQDITQQRRAVEQLHHLAGELEKTNQELRQFASIISHDLRAPLVNLQGFSAELQIAMEQVRQSLDTGWDKLSEEQHRSLAAICQHDIPEAMGFIQSAVQHMDGYINALLKLNRLGRQELQRQVLAMNPLVEQTLPAFAHQIKEQNIQVRVEPLPDAWADPMAMKQIMANLLDNAIKYLDPQRPGKIEISGWKNPGEICYCVKDNGRGIAADDMEKVFAPFRRAGRHNVPGEGMGLAYVQALVRRHGGKIQCASEPGVGSRFTVTLPPHAG